MSAPYLVSYASCGCVRAIRLNDADRVENTRFRDEYGEVVAQMEWPRIKCELHPAHPLNGGGE